MKHKESPASLWICTDYALHGSLIVEDEDWGNFKYFVRLDDDDDA